MLETPAAPVYEESSLLERILLVKKASTYGSLPSSDLAALGELSKERFFPKGSLLLKEGEAVHAIYLIVEGSVEAYHQGQRLGAITSGNGVGGLGLLAGNAFGVDVRAVEDTLALELEADGMFELFEDRFAILHHLMRELSRQLIHEHVEHGLDPGVFFPGSLQPVPPHDLDFVERIMLLRNIGFFRKASINALSEVSRGISQVEFEAGTSLWAEGDPSPGMLLILNGQVAGSTAAGRRYRMGPGSPVGSLDSIANIPRWSSAVTETRVLAFQGTAEGLIDVFEDNFDLARAYLAEMAQALIRSFAYRLQQGEAFSELVPGEYPLPPLPVV
jgi:CRP-like cAMP-binding protein